MVQIKLDDSAFIFDEGIKKRLSLFNIEISDSAQMVLGAEDNKLWLRDSVGKKLQIDFDGNRADYWRTHRGSGEPLARALGLKEGIRHVFDLSAGLGIDAVFMARLGFSITAIERNPLIAFLLAEAKSRSQRPDLKNLVFYYGNAFDFLKSTSLSEPTSAYFDPMYPEKKKSALARQEMRFFRELVGNDSDSLQILEQALSMPFHKIVVKRPLKAESIIENPAYQLESKLIRYDVYYPRSPK